MRRPLANVASLLLGISVLLAGSGMLGTLLGLRAAGAGIGPGMLGWVMSAFYVGYVLGAWLCPSIIRAVGHVRAFAALASVSSAACLLYGLWPDPWVWMGLRLVSGISMIGLYMVVESWLNAEGGAHRHRLFSLYMGLSLLALALGQGLVLFGEGDALAPYALASILFSLGVVPTALGRGAQPALPKAPTLRLSMLLREAPGGLMTAAIAGAVTGVFWTLTAPFAQGHGLATATIAALIAATVVGGALLQAPLGWLSNRIDRRALVSVACVGGAFAAVLLGFSAREAPAWVPAVGLMLGGCIFVLYALAVAQTCDRVPREQALEATQGLLLVNGFGAALGPVLAGAVLGAFGTAALPAVLAGLLLVLALFSGLRIALRPAPPAEQRRGFVALTRTSTVAAGMDPRADPHAPTGPAS
jgi:MFS family permease